MDVHHFISFYSIYNLDGVSVLPKEGACTVSRLLFYRFSRILLFINLNECFFMNEFRLSGYFPMLPFCCTRVIILGSVH